MIFLVALLMLLSVQSILLISFHGYRYQKSIGSISAQIIQQESILYSLLFYSITQIITHIPLKATSITFDLSVCKDFPLHKIMTRIEPIDQNQFYAKLVRASNADEKQLLMAQVKIIDQKKFSVTFLDNKV